MNPWPSPRDIHSLIFDFDGVFTDNKVYVNQHGEEMVRCDRGDGYGFDLLRKYCAVHQLKLDCWILSKEINPVVAARARKIKIGCHQGVDDKLAFARQTLREKFPTLENPFAGVIYLGNDLNDLAMMQAAGFSVAPHDAHPRILQVASAVLPYNGGSGFLRAFIEQFTGIDRLTTSVLTELLAAATTTPAS
jgi:N-acylneuraminate cytidylyltransferase